MRVFIDGVDLSSREVGGVRRYYTNLIQGLVALRAEFVLHAGSLNGLESVHDKVQFMQRRTFRGRRRFPVDNVLLDWAFAGSGCDIFHSCYYSYPLLSSKPSVVTAFDMIHERFPQYFNKPSDRRFVALKRRAFQNATHIIAISESTKQDIIKFCNIPPEKISAVHLGIEPQFRPLQDHDALRSFRERHGLEQPYLLFVGTRYYYKNFTTLLEAFLLSGLDRDLVLVAFGSSPIWREEEIEVLRTHGRGPENRIRLGGYLDDEDLVLAYSAAQALVYPSLYEGFGLPILEAMACGIPVICSAKASLPEIGGDVAVYFKPEDLDSLVEALRFTVAEESQGRVKRGIERAKSFTWQRTACLTRQICEKLSVT